MIKPPASQPPPHILYGDTMSNVTTYQANQQEFITLTPIVCPPRVGKTYGRIIHNPTVDKIKYILQSAANSKVLAIDYETRGVDFSNDIKIVGLGMAWDTGSCYFDWNYSPISEETRESSPLNVAGIEAQSAINSLLLSHTGLIAHNVSFDGGVLRSSTGRHAQWEACTYALLSFLHNESIESRWGLKEAQVSVLGWATSNDIDLDAWLVKKGYCNKNSKPDKGEMWRAPVDILGKYCILDAESCYLLYTEVLRPTMHRFPSMIDWFHSDFMFLIQQLIEQKLHGLLIDKKGLQDFEVELHQDIAAISADFLLQPEVQKPIFAIQEELRADILVCKHPEVTATGTPNKNYVKWKERATKIRNNEMPEFNFNLSSHLQLSKLFYDKLKYPVVIETDSENNPRPSTATKALAKMGDLGAILMERSDRVKSLSFVTAYLELIAERTTMHPSFRAPGTITGRLSGNSPNLQQCFHPDTDVLTLRGWIPVGDLSLTDQVWQVHPNKGRVTGSWTLPESLSNRTYNGSMLGFNSTRIDVSVTMDHRMLLFGASNQTYLHYELLAREMHASNNRHHLRTCTESEALEGLNPQEISNIWNACLVQADGSTARQRNQNLWRFGFRRADKIKWMTDPYSKPRHIDAQGTSIWYALEIKSPYLVPESKSLNVDSLPDGYQDILVEAIAAWDGCKRVRDVVWQSNCEKSIDSVQRYLVRNGYQAKYWTRITGKNKTSHCLTIRKNPRISIRKQDTREVAYIGQVYCLSVPSGYVLTRYKGQTLVIGQCPKTKDMLSKFIARPGHVFVDLDVASLEPTVTTEFSNCPNMEKIYGSNASPYQDFYLFIASTIPGMRERVMAAGYNPDSPTKEGTANCKKVCKADRNACKIVALACAYGGGVNKVMQILEEQNIFMSHTEVEAIHRGYWELFAVVKDFGRSLLFEWKRNKGYVLNGIGRPMAVTEKYNRDLLNRFVQSTGHDIFVKYIRILCTELTRAGIPYVPIIIDFHDASTVEVPDAYEKQAIEVFARSMDLLNAELNGRIKLKGVPMSGKNLAIVKEAQ